MNTNVGYLFYKDYYESLSYRWRNDKFVAEFDGTKQNQQLFAQELLSSVVKQKEKYIDPIQNESFELQTTYPGLLIGSGDNHEILSSEKDQNNKAYVKNELKLGFHFDHTTGLPIIPGSSVKGAIRSGFEFETGYIIELLDVILKENETWNALDDPTKRKTVTVIENTIFEQEGDRCVYERDIFLDAFPVATGHSKKQFLGNDYITPHASPIKSPVPVQFLKVLPQVTYYFAFRLADSEINFEGGLLTLMQAQKRELFLKILLDFGLGAKTNVGYGQLEELNSHLPSLESLMLEDRVNCKIESVIYREKEDKYQIYVIPEIKGYSDFLDKLGKPLPSVKVSKSTHRRVLTAMQDDAIVFCFINRIGDDERIFFKNYIEFQ